MTHANDPVHEGIRNATHVRLVHEGTALRALVFERVDGEAAVELHEIRLPDELVRHVGDAYWEMNVYHAARLLVRQKDPKTSRREICANRIRHTQDPVGPGAYLAVFTSERALTCTPIGPEGRANSKWSNGDNRLDLTGLLRTAPPEAVVAYAKWLLTSVFHPFVANEQSGSPNPDVRLLAIS